MDREALLVSRQKLVTLRERCVAIPYTHDADKADTLAVIDLSLESIDELLAIQAEPVDEQVPSLRAMSGSEE